MSAPRWVRKDVRIYDFSHCKACGVACGDAKTHGGYCSVTTCLACGSPQCMQAGGSNGQCGICYHGLLVGWSGWKKVCGYKGCNEQAVAAVPGKRYACKEHLARRGTDALIAKYLAERPAHWRMFVDPGWVVFCSEGCGRRLPAEAWGACRFCRGLPERLTDRDLSIDGGYQFISSPAEQRHIIGISLDRERTLCGRKVLVCGSYYPAMFHGWDDPEGVARWGLCIDCEVAYWDRPGVRLLQRKVATG